MTIPSAPPISAGIWPVITEHQHRLVVDTKWGRRFGAKRKGRLLKSGKRLPSRHHAGVDIYCDPGDPVVAITDGEVLSCTVFRASNPNKPSTLRADGTPWRVYLLRVLCGPIVICYGEIHSKLKRGDKVVAGQQIGTAEMQKESTMLHLEVRTPDAPTVLKWPWKKPCPPGLLDPTAMLLALAEDARRG